MRFKLRHNAAVSLRNPHLLNKEMISSVSLAVFAVQPQHDTAKAGLFIPESQLMHKIRARFAHLCSCIYILLPNKKI